MVLVVQREWAAMDPRATFKTPITVGNGLNSRMIAYPFWLSECCLVTDGGSALILVGAECARDCRQKLAPGLNTGPVYLLGTGQSVQTPLVTGSAVVRRLRHDQYVERAAFSLAGAFAGL